MRAPLEAQVVMIIPSINGGPLLARMLPTVRCPPGCVVVLDQGSDDETEAVCAEHGVTCVQLGRAHTYTEACNIGVDIARRRGVPYLCVANNDLVFRTDVLAELVAEMDRDRSLGIVAPSQVIVAPRHPAGLLATRAFWRLGDVEFAHDFEFVDPRVQRLESDFCELTCAVVRMSVIEEIGFVDDAYGFYHEDADFGFRLRQHGYNCAYLQKSQIDHFTSSTFDRIPQRKLDLLKRNRRYFTEKHLGLGVSSDYFDVNRATAWLEAVDDLGPELRRFGLFEPGAADLVVADPGVESSGYILTRFTGAAAPERWARYVDRYAAVFTASRETTRQLIDRGFPRVFTIPIGVDTDLFHPWAPAERHHTGPTFLGIVDGREPVTADLLQAWARFRSGHSDEARLILCGRGLGAVMGRRPDRSLRSGPYNCATYALEAVEVLEIVQPLRPGDWAALFRGADFALVTGADEPSGRAALRAMACGTPAIVPADGLGGEIRLLGSPSLGPRAVITVDTVLETLTACGSLDGAARRELAQAGVDHVRAAYTKRHSAMAIRQALAKVQTRSPEPAILRLERRELTTTPVLDSATAAIPVHAARRIEKLLARRLAAAGNIVAQFATTWHEAGVNAAVAATRAEIRSILARRRAPRFPEDRTAVQASSDAVRAGSQPIGPTQPSPLLIGYLDAQLGLGQSSRGLAWAMAENGIDFSIYPVGDGVEGRRGEAFMPHRVDVHRPHAVNVIEVTPDELPRVQSSIGPAHFAKSYNVLRAYWELSRAPEAWRRALTAIDEIWAPNAFVAESFRAIFGGPITVIPPCVVVDPGGRPSRTQFGLNPGRFYFLFAFDYYSFPQRKNPLAAVRSFQRAFAASPLDVGLIVKSAGRREHHPTLKRELQDRSVEDGRIVLIDENLSQQEMLDLTASSDAYVSLHRAEGFGLGMVEAMAMGKPVIATDYSGSTDFLTEETGFPVPFALRPVASDEYVHATGQVWAEPDENVCADLMLRVVSDPDSAKARARAAQIYVAQRYGPKAVGSAVAERLREIARG